MTVRPPVPSSAPTRRLRLAMLLMVLLTLGAGEVASTSIPAAAETAHLAQDPEVTVPSTTEAGATAGTSAEPEIPLNNAEEVAAENRRIWLVVGGLVVVAIALMLVTIRYWRQTRPVAVTAEPEDRPVEAEAEVEAESDRGRREGRRSRRSVAGADHATADSAWEPRGTGEHDRIDPAPAVRRARISSEQRRAAYEAARR